MKGLLGGGDVRIFLDDPSTNPGSVVIRAPANVVGKWDWDVQVASPQVATLPTGLSDSGSLQGSGQVRLSFTGLTPGITTYTFTAHDDQRKSYGVEGRILVGRRYIAGQNQIELNVGQTYTLQLYRPAQLASSGPLRLTASSDADGRAVATVGDANFGVGDSATSVTITANRGGNARYLFTDPSGNAVEVNVRVNGFYVTPNPVRLRAGQEVPAVVFRNGISGPLRIRAKSNFDREIAGVSPEGELVFPPAGAEVAGIVVSGKTAGTALYDVEDEKGNKYELQIIVESPGAFVASSPVFTEVDDANEADVGVRNANGQLVPGQWLDVSYNGFESVQFYDPAGEARPPVRRQAVKSATVVPPGGKVTVRMNEQGFLRMLYLAGPAAGRATVRFEAPAFGAVEYPVTINPRRAPAPDSMQVTPPASVRAGVDSSIQVVARREGQPAGTVTVTFHITGGTFSTGSRFASNTISQVTTNSVGTATATFQATARARSSSGCSLALYLRTSA